MRIIKTVETIRVESETEAQTLINKAKDDQQTGDYILKKAGYEYKVKKSKGDIIDDCYIVSLTKEFGGIWDNGEQ